MFTPKEHLSHMISQKSISTSFFFFLELDIEKGQPEFQLRDRVLVLKAQGSGFRLQQQKKIATETK